MTTVDAAGIARMACSEHGASQRYDELQHAIELAASTNPQVIVEIGCDAGGTLYAWRHVCADVYGITLEDNTYSAGGSGKPIHRHGACVYFGDSHRSGTLGWLMRKLAGRKIDVLVIDGDHSVVGVGQDLAMYAPLVRVGGVVLMHDIAVPFDPRAHVWEVWPLIAGSDDFETSEILSMVDGPRYGWGVIRVRGGEPWDSFASNPQ